MREDDLSSKLYQKQSGFARKAGLCVHPSGEKQDSAFQILQLIFSLFFFSLSSDRLRAQPS